MVLHHVAQRACLVVVIRAPLQPDAFGDGDLDVVDIGRVPHRLVEHIGEAQRHQVLHRLLAEIVVDAEDLIFAEMLPYRLVQSAGRPQVAADGLFHHEAGAIVGKAGFPNARGEVSEQSGADGKIEGADAIVACRIEKIAQFSPAGILLGVDLAIVQAGEEAVEGGLVDIALGDMLLERAAGEVAIVVVGKIGAGGADDPRALGDLAVLVAVVERRQKLALGQIAAAAENDVIEEVDGDDLAGQFEAFRCRCNRPRAPCVPPGAQRSL